MQDQKEALFNLINKLLQKQWAVIVEGKEDKRALDSLGFENIFTLNKHPLFQVVELAIIEANRLNCAIMVLTDLDKKGKSLYAALNHALCQHGVHIDNTLRHFLFKNTQLRQIEGMVRYLARE